MMLLYIKELLNFIILLPQMCYLNSALFFGIVFEKYNYEYSTPVLAQMPEIGDCAFLVLLILAGK